MSSILTHPDQVFYDPEKKLSKLFWDKKIDHALAPPNGAEYYLRGGISFPSLMESGGFGASRDVTGFAVMVAYCFSNRKYYVVGECEFSTIDNILDPDGNGIALTGACNFFNKMWTTYYALDYYWSGHSETVMKYILQVVRCDIIKPTPHLIEISLGVPGQVQQGIYEKLQRECIFYKKAGLVHEGIQKYDARNLSDMPVSVHALSCALTGMDRYPWRPSPED